MVVGASWGATVALELVGTRPGLASELVFIDGPVQSAANMFSWEDAQRLMQPPLPRFTAFADAIAESRRDFGGAWDDDLEPFVKARVVDDGAAYVLTLTAAARLQLLRGLYDSQPDTLCPRMGRATAAAAEARPRPSDHDVGDAAEPSAGDHAGGHRPRDQPDDDPRYRRPRIEVHFDTQCAITEKTSSFSRSLKGSW